jgi:hypothetical protein
MTQVFADDEAATMGMIARKARIPAQGIPAPRDQSREAGLRELRPPGEAGSQDPLETEPPGFGHAASSPALTPGKGVRAVRCVGCCRDTLPRSDDGAPLCARCSELLANAEQTATGPLTQLSGPFTGWTARWLRRRDDAPLG